LHGVNIVNNLDPGEGQNVRYGTASATMAKFGISSPFFRAGLDWSDRPGEAPLLTSQKRVARKERKERKERKVPLGVLCFLCSLCFLIRLGFSCVSREDDQNSDFPAPISVWFLESREMQHKREFMKAAGRDGIVTPVPGFHA
jgi:hypothetical protein